MTKPIRTIKILFETLRELSLGNKDTALNYLHSLNVEKQGKAHYNDSVFKRNILE